MNISLASNFNQIISHNNALRITVPLRDGVNINMSLSSAEFCSIYKTTTQDDHKTTADSVVPYIADAIAIVFANQYVNFDSSNIATMMLSMKQNMALVGSVVATDYISRMIVDIIPDEFKEGYIDPMLDYTQEFCSYSLSTFNQMTDIAQD